MVCLRNISVDTLHKGDTEDDDDDDDNDNNNKDVHNYRPASTIKNSAARSKGKVFWYHTWPIITQSGKQVTNISEQPDVPASG